jgi:hypothetical protein
MPTSFAKRQKEKNRIEKRQEKQAKRVQRKEERANRPRPDGEEDPDIAGIVPGPQPIPEDY